MRCRWCENFPRAGYSLYIYNPIGRSPIKIYKSKTSDVPITTFPQVVIGSDGKAEFWVDSEDYDLDLLINIEVYDPAGKLFVLFKNVSIFSLKDYFANIYIREEFTGGASNALDGIDGADLDPNSFALVLKNGICYPYRYIEGATNEESSPYIIAPDINPNGRWFLYSVSNADKLDSKEGSWYTNASNLNAGTVPVERLSGTYNIDISGNAVTATDADKLDGYDANHFATADHTHMLGNLSNVTLGVPNPLEEGQSLVFAGGSWTNAFIPGVMYERDYDSNNDGVIDEADYAFNADNANNATLWDGSAKFVSPDDPDPNLGNDGDFWFQYEC